MAHLVTTAINIAKDAHQGQKYGDDADYFEFHVMGVARVAEEHYGANSLEYVASMLHDVVEDSEYTLGDLILAGIPIQLVSVIDFLSKNTGMDRSNSGPDRYTKYLKRVALDPTATNVKLIDMSFNLAHSEKGSPRWVKYRDGIEALLQFRREAVGES